MVRPHEECSSAYTGAIKGKGRDRGVYRAPRLPGRQKTPNNQAAILRSLMPTCYKCKTSEEIQRTAEAWLRQRGYYPRTPEFLGGKNMPDQRGWSFCVGAIGSGGNTVIDGVGRGARIMRLNALQGRNICGQGRMGCRARTGKQSTFDGATTHTPRRKNDRGGEWC